MAFESLTIAQLETMRDNLIAAHAKSLNATSYGIGSRNLTRAQPDQIFKQLEQVTTELAHRTDRTGGVVWVVLGDPE